MALPSGLSAGVIAVIITVVVANLGNNIVAPILPSIKDYFGSGVAEIGLMVSGFALGRLVMDLPSGYLADRVNPQRLFNIGIALSAGGALLAAFAPSLQQLILLRVMMGVGSSIISTVALVMLVGLARPDQRGRVLAFYMSAKLFGQAISPAIGGYLGAVFNWRAPFIFCTLTPLISLPLNAVAISGVARRQKESKALAEGSGGESAPGRTLRDAPSEQPRANRSALGAVYFGTFVNFFNRQGMRSSILPLYGAMILNMDPGALGIILTLGSVVTIFLALPAGAAADQAGRKVLLLPGMLVLSLGNLVLFSGSGQLTFIAATVLVSLGILSNTMFSGLVADLTPEHMVGKGMGNYRFAADSGVAAGPLVLGILVERYSFEVAALAGAVVVLLGAAVVLLLVPRLPASLASQVGKRAAEHRLHK